MTDFRLLDGGSIFVLSALTEPAEEWVSENVSGEGYQPDYPARLYIEPRYVELIVVALQGSGFRVALA